MLEVLHGMNLSRRVHLVGLSMVAALLISGCRTAHEPPAANTSVNRSAWMQQARFGVMTHYLADWRARVDGEPASVEHWNELVDHFDVEGLADQLKLAGADYHILTIGQNSG